MAFPIAAVMAGLSIAGGILTSKDGRKTIDPEVLKKLFGPQAITAEALEMFNAVANSPVGQQMMTNAAQSGGSFSNALQASLGKAGFSGDAAGSPIAAFTGAAGGEAANSMQRQVRSDMYGNALNAAQQNIGQRMGVWAGSQGIQQQQPTFGQQMGSALLGVGAEAASLIGAGTTKPAGSGGGTIAPAGGAGASVVNPGYFGQPAQGYRTGRGTMEKRR